MAVYGAILSTILALITILQYRRDRSHCKLTLSQEITTTLAQQTGLSALLVSVTNTGRRPLTLVYIGCFGNGRYGNAQFIGARQHGQTLTETQHIQLRIPVERLLPAAHITGIYVQDSAGHNYWASRRQLRRIIQKHPYLTT